METCSWRKQLYVEDQCDGPPNLPMSSTLSHTLLAVWSHHILCHLHRTILVCFHHHILQSSSLQYIHKCLCVSVCSRTVLYYLQDFDGYSVHPPDVTIEDKKVDVFPVDSMLLNGLWHYYTIDYTMLSWIVWIWFHQKRCPIKLHRGVIVLFINKNPK